LFARRLLMYSGLQDGAAGLVVEGSILGMSEPRPPLRYFPGDEITLRLTFTHDSPMHAVEVVYKSEEDSSYTITLSGNPEPQEGSKITGMSKQSIVDMSGVVDASYPPGLYTIHRLVFYTFSGGEITFLSEDAALHHVGWVPGQGPTHWPALELIMGDEAQGISISGVELEPEDD
jgi:hypothetical protein